MLVQCCSKLPQQVTLQTCKHKVQGFQASSFCMSYELRLGMRGAVFQGRHSLSTQRGLSIPCAYECLYECASVCVSVAVAFCHSQEMCSHPLHKNSTPCIKRLKRLTRVQSSAQARSCQQGMREPKHITENSKQKAQSFHLAETACSVYTLSTGFFFLHTKMTHHVGCEPRCNPSNTLRSGVWTQL